MIRRTRAGILVLGVVLAATAMSGCGSGGHATTSASKAKAIAPSLGAEVCAAYLRATRDEDQPSVQARRALAELAQLHPTGADRTRLRDVVEAFREVERVWSDTAPTTPTAFTQAASAASDGYGKAGAAAHVDPCPRPDSSGATTTSAPDAAKPTWRFTAVDRPTSGDGLWVYFDAACPADTGLTGVTDPWVANPGAPDVSFAALVAGLPAVQPFTAAAADSAFAAKPDFSGTCA